MNVIFFCLGAQIIILILKMCEEILLTDVGGGVKCRFSSQRWRGTERLGTTALYV